MIHCNDAGGHAPLINIITKTWLMSHTILSEKSLPPCSYSGTTWLRVCQIKPLTIYKVSTTNILIHLRQMGLGEDDYLKGFLGFKPRVQRILQSYVMLYCTICSLRLFFVLSWLWWRGFIRVSDPNKWVWISEDESWVAVKHYILIQPTQLFLQSVEICHGWGVCLIREEVDQS